MLGFPTAPKYLIAPLLLTLIIILLHLGEPRTVEWFGFFPKLVLDGQWWRIVSGQLLHTNGNHMWLNLAGLLLVWALHGEHYSPKHFFLVSMASLLFIGVCLLLFVDYGHYAGLSGVLHSLLIYGALIDIKKGDRTGWLLLAGVLIKVIYEVLVGPSSSTEQLIGAYVAFEAHVLGVISGALFGLLNLYFTLKAPKK